MDVQKNPPIPPTANAALQHFSTAYVLPHPQTDFLFEVPPADFRGKKNGETNR